MSLVPAALAGFFKSDFNKLLVASLIVLGAALLLAPSPQAAQESSFVHFFFLPTCPHCHEQAVALNPVLESNYGIRIISHDVSTPEGGALFRDVTERFGLEKLVPTTLVGDEAFTGYSAEIGVQIEGAVKACAENGCRDPITNMTARNESRNFIFDIPFIGRTDVRSLSLPVLAIVLGLIDGFNPCAMWVLVYLIALVMEMNDRRRVWLIVGLFVLSSGVLYFLFMTAWLNAFLFLGYVKGVTIAIGLVALGAGILGVKESWECRNKPLTCKITDTKGKETTISDMRRIVSMPLTLATFIAIVALAFAVNSIEFLCSSAIPAVFTQVLAMSGISTFEHYAYILLYTLFFMLDDLVIFGLAAFAVSKTAVGEKYTKFSKAIGSVIMLALGLLLLFAPQLLR